MIDIYMMNDFTIARILHIIAIIMWVGGVAFVTTVILPGIRHNQEARLRLRAFHRIENGFSRQARIWVILAGASGLWMTWRGDLWVRFTGGGFWWMQAMLLLWLIFAIMLFLLEPMVLHKRMASSPQPEKDFERMERIHRILLIMLVITSAGAVGGSHGLW